MKSMKLVDYSSDDSDDSRSNESKGSKEERLQSGAGPDMQASLKPKPVPIPQSVPQDAQKSASNMVPRPGDKGESRQSTAATTDTIQNTVLDNSEVVRLLRLKDQGHHFNQTLSSNRSLQRPGLFRKQMELLGIEQGSLSGEYASTDNGFTQWVDRNAPWNNQGTGSRSSIQFVKPQSTQSTLPDQHTQSTSRSNQP
uniref:ARAD1C25564p n=1 Tax=Blastobotrys adeninivorans TaxID=409370 RepID=A0A060T2I5_BLAAD